MECPRCLSEEIRTIASNPSEHDKRIRKKICRKCGLIINTTEKIDTVEVYNQNTNRIAKSNLQTFIEKRNGN